MGASVAFGGIVLQPNTLLVADRTNNSLRLLDAVSGSQISSVAMPTNTNRTLEGVAIVGNEAYVCFKGTSQSQYNEIDRVNLETGSLSLNLYGFSPVGLASRSPHLVLANWGGLTTPSVVRHTTSGGFFSSQSYLPNTTFGLGEAVDDIAWSGSRYVTVSNYRLPGAGSFNLISWNGDQPSYLIYEAPTLSFSYPAANMWAEGLDVNTQDGSYWVSFNPTQGSSGNSVIDRIDAVTGARTRLQLSGMGAISDLVYVTIPAPAAAAIFAASLLHGVRRQRRSA